LDKNKHQNTKQQVYKTKLEILLEHKNT